MEAKPLCLHINTSKILLVALLCTLSTVLQHAVAICHYPVKTSYCLLGSLPHTLYHRVKRDMFRLMMLLLGLDRQIGIALLANPVRPSYSQLLRHPRNLERTHMQHPNLRSRRSAPYTTCQTHIFISLEVCTCMLMPRATFYVILVIVPKSL